MNRLKGQFLEKLGKPGFFFAPFAPRDLQSRGQINGICNSSSS
jgi:hypothetical protein